MCLLCDTVPALVQLNQTLSLSLSLFLALYVSQPLNFFLPFKTPFNTASSVESHSRVVDIGTSSVNR